jgi:uncharacterized caspase-like protein
MVADKPPARSDPGVPGAGERVALVIGNVLYPDADPPLDLPARDARALADELRRSGFDVVLGENLTRQRLLDALAGFKTRIRRGSTALLFFSGYGIQAARQPYMIPVDAQVWAERDVARDGVSVEAVLTEIDARGAGVKLLILDAARRNPFERRFRRSSSGLVPIAMPTNSLVIYATGPGHLINEAGGKQSLFVRELLKELRAPGATAEEAFARTRIGVSRVSEAEQVPWVSSSLVDSFSFRPSERR